jgi:uncharacterized protein YkwD
MYMIRLRFLYALSFAIALAIVAPAWETYSNAQSRQGTVLAAQSSSRFKVHAGLPDPNEIYKQVNKQRQAAGLLPLERNDILAKVAEERAEDMSKNSYYAHKNPLGKYFYDLLADDGYKTTYSCENLGLDFTTDPGVYINAWLKSTAGHRQCALNPQVTDAGYAVAAIANNSTQDIPSYVVVAIHSTEPTVAK